MKPKIELEIENHTKAILKYTSFIALGFGAVASIINKEISILAPLLAMPFAIDAISTKKLLNDRKRNKTKLLAYKPFFKKEMTKWLKEYLNNSENITEKKYKLIFLNLWAQHKEIPLDTIFDKKVVSDLSNELIQKGETIYSLEDMFYKHFSTVMKAQFKEIIPKNFLEEDQNKTKKIDIAKKVYEEFKEGGIAAKAFIIGKEFSFLLELQNYKFNEIDFVFINQYIKDSTKEEIYSINYFNPYLNNSIEAINKVVGYEDNLNNLLILKSYCENMKEKGHDSMMGQITEIEKSLNIKFEYITMLQELNKNEVITNKKINKI